MLGINCNTAHFTQNIYQSKNYRGNRAYGLDFRMLKLDFCTFKDVFYPFIPFKFVKRSDSSDIRTPK